MINRYSSRLMRLDEGFLNKKLKNAKNYDRIAGYFCSSILEVAGENIEAVSGKVRIICNSNLEKEDVDIAVKAQQMKQEWCEYGPEEKYSSPAAQDRLSRLYRLLASGKLEVRVIPDEVYGLMHGKAGVITYNDGSKTSFLGSINETKSAFSLNYELVWEDNSDEAVKWVQEEFDYFWNNKYAVNLCDFVIKDIDRISKRRIVPLHDWREQNDEKIGEAAAETPVFRTEFGLWEHQKYFVERAFREHQKPGGARLLLADQVGLGKTVQLAMSAKLMALYGDKPILIIVPKTLVFQWQDEMMSLLDMPSAVWTGHGWQDETGYFYQSEGAKSILRCPRRVGIISQGLVARRTEAADYLKQQTYECIIVDEYEIIGLNLKSQLNQGFRGLVLFLLTLKIADKAIHRRQYAQNRNLSAERGAASLCSASTRHTLPTYISFRRSTELSACVDLHRVPLRHSTHVPVARAA